MQTGWHRPRRIAEWLVSRVCRGSRARLKQKSVAVLSGILILVCGVQVSHGGVSEDDLKAAFLYKLLKFVRWPDQALGDPSVPLRVCITGGDSFREHFEEKVRGRSVSGHSVRVSGLGGAEDLEAGDAARSCHAIFVRGTGVAAGRRLLEGLAGAPVLTVGESEGFCRRGGMISFLRRGARMRFEINVEETRKAGLTVRSQFVKMATAVETE